MTDISDLTEFRQPPVEPTAPKSSAMKICVDVFYYGDLAIASAVAFDAWTDSEAASEAIHVCDEYGEYIPGQFYRRELPAITGVLQAIPCAAECVIIDGYVWLDEQQSPGLGAHLAESLGPHISVIGVAKNRYRSGGAAIEVIRGESNRPLYVTSTGMDAIDAADHIRKMHGQFRIPTLLKRADRLGREHAEEMVDAE